MIFIYLVILFSLPVTLSPRVHIWIFLSRLNTWFFIYFLILCNVMIRFNLRSSIFMSYCRVIISIKNLKFFIKKPHITCQLLKDTLILSFCKKLYKWAFSSTNNISFDNLSKSTWILMILTLSPFGIPHF